MEAIQEKKTANKGPISYTAAVKQIHTGGIRPVYLLYGDEEYLQERLVSILQAAWLGGAGGGSGVSREDGRAMTQSQAVDLAGQMELFTERRLVVIDEPAFIPCSKEQRRTKAGAGEQDEREDEAGEETPADGGAGTKRRGKDQSRRGGDQPLLAYLDQPVSDSCLVLRCRKGKPDRRNRLVAEIAGREGLVETSALAPGERVPYLHEAMQKAGKQCPRNILEQIARQPWGLAFCLKELEKIVAYAGEESVITAGMADAVLTPSLEANIFRMVDALGQRRRPAALRELRILLESGESPFGVFAMMLRQFRLIFKAKACMQSGMGKTQIAQALGAQPFIAEKSAAQSKFYTFSELEHAMELFCDKDLAMKSSAPPGQVLEDLIFELGK